MTPTEPATPAAPAAPAEPAGVTPEPAVAPEATAPEPVWEFEADGQKIAVKPSEAKDYFLRQQDYTRKTQELAQQKAQLSDAEALRAALDADPQNTINILQDAYGIQPGAAAPGQPPAEPAYVDPEEQRWQRVEGAIGNFEQQQLQQQVEAELQRVEQTYGAENVDRGQLIAHAIRREIPNLDAAYRDMAYDTAMQTQTQQREAADAAALAAKQGAAFVEGGSTAAAGSVTSGSTGGPPDTVQAAWDLAKAQLNQ